MNMSAMNGRERTFNKLDSKWEEPARKPPTIIKKNESYLKLNPHRMIIELNFFVSELLLKIKLPSVWILSLFLSECGIII